MHAYIIENKSTTGSFLMVHGVDDRHVTFTSLTRNNTYSFITQNDRTHLHKIKTLKIRKARA